MQYFIGDKIVHPIHGAGIIKSIETREFMGSIKEYYMAHMIIKDIEIAIPLDKMDKIGIRKIMDEETKTMVIKVLTQEIEIMPDNWNRRYRENLDKIKTGDAIEIAGVVRNLYLLNIKKALSSIEKKMLTTAMQFIVTEISMVKDENIDDVEVYLESLMKLTN